MKRILPFVLGYIVFIPVYLAVMFLFDGDDFEWRKNMIVAIPTGLFTMGGLYFFGRKKEK